MKKEKRVTVWYIEPKDARTNEAISLGTDGLFNSEDVCTLECADGVTRDVYRVKDYAFVARVWRSRKTLNLTFEIFRAQGNGKPDLWQFPVPKKRTLEILKKKGLISTGGTVHQKSATRF